MVAITVVSLSSMIEINGIVLHYKCASERVRKSRKGERKNKMKEILTICLKINKYYIPEKLFHGGRHV